MYHVQTIDSFDLPELEPYRTMRRQLEHREQGIFVAEGEKVVRRLLESDFAVVSVLLPEKWLPEMDPLLRARSEDIRVFVAEKKWLETLTGFSMYQGLLAVGRIPTRVALDEILARSSKPRLLAAADGLSSAENLGALVRNCAAFNTQALIVGETCSSPFLRRAVRSSMGAIFQLPIVETASLIQVLGRLREDGIRIIAAHPHVAGRTLSQAHFSGDCCIVFGSEGYGISAAVLAACDDAAAIPMPPAVDSLNVGSAAAVFLNPFLFSTKYYDWETSLYYFGHRYYNASTGRWLSRDPIGERRGINVYGFVANDPENRIDFIGLADTELHHVIPEWLARYSSYGARNQGLCVRLTQQFHRGSGGLETDLTQIRNLLRSGAIDQFGAYNRVLLAQLRNLPAVIRNNRTAVGISGGTAIAFQGAVRAGLAQVGYFTYGQAALGATGIGLVGSGAYFVYDASTQTAELENYTLEQQGNIDAYNRQIELARRASDRDIALILNFSSGLIHCSNQKAQSSCGGKFKSAMNRNYYLIETTGASQVGIPAGQLRGVASEQLFIDYLQCLKKAGCCIADCN